METLEQTINREMTFLAACTDDMQRRRVKLSLGLHMQMLLTDK